MMRYGDGNVEHKLAALNNVSQHCCIQQVARNLCKTLRKGSKGTIQIALHHDSPIRGRRTLDTLAERVQHVITQFNNRKCIRLSTPVESLGGGPDSSLIPSMTA